MRIYVQLDSEDFPGLVGSDFGFKSHCVTAYLSRVVLKKLKFRSELFRRIIFNGKNIASDKNFLTSNKSLIQEVQFDEAEYLALSSAESTYKFIIKFIERGLLSLKREYNIPYDELLEGLQSFSDDGYQNKWLYNKKNSNGCVVRLNCELNLEAFILTLQIEKNLNIIFQEVLLTEDPDELCYAHEFKDLAVSNEKITVTSKRGGGVLYEKAW